MCSIWKKVFFRQAVYGNNKLKHMVKQSFHTCLMPESQSKLVRPTMEIDTIVVPLCDIVVAEIEAEVSIQD